MANNVRPVRGMNDILPPEGDRWLALEQRVAGLLSRYGFQHVRVPLLEQTSLFKRSIGEATDIVEKEMYTFDDRNGESLTLRPEATAGLVRAAITHGLTHNQKHKLWTTGPMFRYERPQKGRYRQFHQIDVEAFGYEGPDIDVEMIAMSARLWRDLGIQRVRLELNSLGTPQARQNYRGVLVEYFSKHKAALDEDSMRRLGTNPMRILDSKNPDLADLISKAPVLTDYLDAESSDHFSAVCRALDALDIEYSVNPRLVRGLDYYSRTVFEWVTDALGAQGAVCSGGRYDGLFEQLGGKPVPAIGWAIGVERLLALCDEEGVSLSPSAPSVYLLGEPSDACQSFLLALSESLRDSLPELAIMRHLGGGSIKSQLKKADKSGADWALIVGERELGQGVVSLKPLRTLDEQRVVKTDELASVLSATAGT
ncbi:MAG: histidine--tRNA ligase [Pseudomonadota bacterium]